MNSLGIPGLWNKVIPFTEN